MSVRDAWIKVQFEGRRDGDATGTTLLYETRMPVVPRVGEAVEFPSGRVANVKSVGYVLDRGVGLGESTAVVRVT